MDESPMTSRETLEALKSRCGDVPSSEFRGDTRVTIARERLREAMKLLKEERGFDLLVDVTCVDYLNYRDAQHRFGLVYLLANTATNERLTVRVFVNEPNLTVSSVEPLWAGANWME